jgi:exopolyphosphatase/guanosine-5'-triphosphate,3'-diphosphate pyrophosphatase
LCRHYGIDPKRQEPVVQDATQLFEDLKSVHHLSADYKLWLQSAAMMHPVGKFMNYQGHHRHTQYIIANSELYGFTPEQRLIVSAIARYLGKSRPSPTDRVLRYIPIEQHLSVKQAAVLLRMAVALHQNQSSPVTRFRTRVTPKKVSVMLMPGRKGADLELWALRKEADYFREVFARDLLVSLD